MASSYTSLLGFVLPVTGELSGTWGTVWNDSGTSLIDSAIAGTTTLSTDADVTLTTTTGTANQARQAIILWTANGTTTRNITAPAQSKIYTVINASAGTQSIVFRGAGPTAGVTIVKGESALVAWNGSDFIKISNAGGAASFTNVTVSGTTTLSGLTASTALALNASKEVVSVTNTGTGNNVLSASPTLTGTVAGASLQLSSLTSGRVTYAGASGLLQDSANLTFDGTTLTANALTTTSTVTINGGTANGVAYLNGSKVLTTGSALTFDGTTFGVSASGQLLKLTTSGNTASGGLAYLRFYDSVGARGYVGYVGTDTMQVTGNNVELQAATANIFTVASSEQMRLTSTGLGIGTSSITYKLDVSVTGNNGIRTTSSAGQQTYLGNTGGESVVGTLNNYGFGIITNGSIRGYFDSSGNLGIGTSSPGAKLNVQATGIQGLFQYDASNQILVFHSGSNGYFGTYTNQPLILRTNNTDRVTIDTSGNLGLGVTPSAWDSSQKAIEFNPGGYGIASYSSGALQVFANAYYDNVGWKYKSNGLASQYYQQTGKHIWSTAASGTAGNAITFTQAMTLDASGNLGVGITSPTSRLHLKGPAGSNPNTNGVVFQYSTSTNNFGAVGLDNASGDLVVAAGSGCSLRFYTNSDLATTNERARIDSSGNFLIGTAAIATNATDGFLYIPTCAGTPTGTPTAKTGLAPMVIDSTNNKMYIYSGGAWRALN